MNLIIRHQIVTLNNNQMSGDTFPVRDYIKSYLGGKWNADSKTWTVDTAKVNNLIERSAIHTTDEQPATKKDTVTRNGWCNKCHSYCYGDCDSH